MPEPDHFTLHKQVSNGCHWCNGGSDGAGRKGTGGAPIQRPNQDTKQNLGASTDGRGVQSEGMNIIIPTMAGGRLLINRLSSGRNAAAKINEEGGGSAAKSNRQRQETEVVSSSLVNSYQHQRHRVSKSSIAQQSA